MLRGMLDVVVLRLLADKPLHGYAVINAIRKRYGVYLGPSTVYPLLNTLEEQGYIESEWMLDADRPRKVYRLTREGYNLLQVSEATLSVVVQPLLVTSTA